MLKQIYLSIKSKIIQPWYFPTPIDPDDVIEDLVRVDWYLGQDRQYGQDHVLNTPVCYIEFLTTPLVTLPSNVQHGTIKFNVILLTETVFGDDRDMLHPKIGHQALETNIYKAIQGQRTVLNINGKDITIHESIVRRQLTTHTSINNLVKSIQYFECIAYDYSAYPQYQEILASLNLEAYLVKKL